MSATPGLHLVLGDEELLVERTVAAILRAARASAQAEFRRSQASASVALSALAATWGGTAAEIAEIEGG